MEYEAWFASLSFFAREYEQGEVEALFEAAANGALWDSNDEKTPIKPIRTDPEIFELRRTALSKQLRFYHGEPSKHPTLLVGLHRHIKSSDDLQQTEIEYAVTKFHP